MDDDKNSVNVDLAAGIGHEDDAPDRDDSEEQVSLNDDDFAAELADLPQDDDVAEIARILGTEPRFEFVSTKGQRKGKPVWGMIENTVALLDHLGVELAFNEMRKELEVRGRTGLDDQEAQAAYLLNMGERFGLDKPATLKRHLLEIAHRNRYHPVRDWIEAVEWDGVDRLPAMYDTIHESDGFDPELKKLLLYKWFVTAVAALYEPGGISAQGLIVLVGADGVGKTRWLMRLVPENSHFAQESAFLDPKDKDSVIVCTSCWLSELGEIDAVFKKVEQSRMKGFLTRREDPYRSPYGEKFLRWPRRTVFFGSTNDENYLLDKTGNRRYWTIPVDAVDWNHDIDGQQLWAQILAMYRHGAEWWLSPCEQQRLAESNHYFEREDAVRDVLARTFDFPQNDSELGAVWMSSTEVAQILYGGTQNQLSLDGRGIGTVSRPVGVPKDQEAQRIGLAMKALGARKRKSDGMKYLVKKK